MFTDSLVTPVRLEILLDLLREYSRREWTRVELYKTLQPDNLPAQQDKTDKHLAAKATIGAALELDLVQEEGRAIVGRLHKGDRRISRDIILQAFDRRVLAATEVEPWFSPFYSYLLGQGSAAARTKTGDAWASSFVSDVLQNRKEANPFNGDKYGKIIQRWYPYVGLGWRDPAGIFHPNPYTRLKRALPLVFDREAKLTSDEFMEALAEHCPEVDGGTIFRTSNPTWASSVRICSLGLSHALVDLHLDGCIELTGGKDSRGWSVEAARPPRQGFWDKFDFVHFKQSEVVAQ